MAPEESNVRLYHRLEDGLGKDLATLLVEHFATKQDIADLRAEMRDTFVTKVEFIEFKAEVREGLAEVKVAMATLESTLHRDMKNMALLLVGTNVALVCAAAAFVRLS